MPYKTDRILKPREKQPYLFVSARIVRNIAKRLREAVDNSATYKPQQILLPLITVLSSSKGRTEKAFKRDDD